MTLWLREVFTSGVCAYIAASDKDSRYDNLDSLSIQRFETLLDGKAVNVYNV